jgi:hypothetical protein
VPIETETGISNQDEMDRTYSTHEGHEKLTHHFVGKAKGKRLLGRTRRRCGDNIKIDFKKIGCVANNEPSFYMNGGIIALI